MTVFLASILWNIVKYLPHRKLCNLHFKQQRLQMIGMKIRTGLLSQHAAISKTGKQAKKKDKHPHFSHRKSDNDSKLTQVKPSLNHRTRDLISDLLWCGAKTPQQWPLTTTCDAKNQSHGFPLCCKAFLTSSAIITPRCVQFSHTHLQYILIFSVISPHMGHSHECERESVSNLACFSYICTPWLTFFSFG